MRSIRILVALLVLSTPCLAAEDTPRSWVYRLGEYSFRIPTPLFFEQLDTQFCKPLESVRCQENLSELKQVWLFFYTHLQVIENKAREDPAALFEVGIVVGYYEKLNAKVMRFIETEGMSIEISTPSDDD